MPGNQQRGSFEDLGKDLVKVGEACKNAELSADLADKIVAHTREIMCMALKAGLYELTGYDD